MSTIDLGEKDRFQLICEESNIMFFVPVLRDMFDNHWIVANAWKKIVVDRDEML